MLSISHDVIHLLLTTHLVKSGYLWSILILTLASPFPFQWSSLAQACWLCFSKSYQNT